MLKTSVGYSTSPDAMESGKESANKALAGVSNPKLAMLYTDESYSQEQVIVGTKEILGDIPVIGCTSSGAIIVPDGVISSDTGFSGMMLIDDPDMTVAVAGHAKKKDARETGKMVALEAVKKAGLKKVPSYFYMVASPGEEESYLKGIQDVIGRVPFFGGSAADNTVSGNWKIFADSEVFSDGVAVAFIYTDKKFVTEYTGAYDETSNVGIITKLEGKRTLMEIDGVPALQKYADWSGKDVESLKGANLLSETVLSPLGVKDRLGDLIAVRHPMAGNADLSMNIGNDLSEKTAVIRLETTVDGLINSTGNALKEVNSKIKSPAGYFLVHCGGRKLGIGERIDEVHKQLLKEAKGKPFITIFTFGEYGYKDHGLNTCGGLMLSFTGISE